MLWSRRQALGIVGKLLAAFAIPFRLQLEQAPRSFLDQIADAYGVDPVLLGDQDAFVSNFDIEAVIRADAAAHLAAQQDRAFRLLEAETGRDGGYLVTDEDARALRGVVRHGVALLRQPPTLNVHYSGASVRVGRTKA